MKTIAVGLLGYGHAGTVFHAPLIQSAVRLSLAAVATSRGEQLARDLPGTRRAASPEELFADPEIALIVVATPNETHRNLALAALRAGKHVVVDKPLANSAREADELIACARESGRTLSVFQNRRWDGDFLTVKRLIGAGKLGEVSFFESHFDRFRPEPKAGWREQAKEGSGILYDLGAHLIDQALNLFGLPDDVAADVAVQRPGARVDDYFHLVLRWGTRRAVLHASMLARAPGPRFLIHGLGGSFVKYGLDVQEEALKAGLRPGAADWGCDRPESYGILTTADGAATRVETESGAYQNYYSGLAECLLDDAPVPVKPEDARDALIVLEAARLSSAERRTVPIVRP